MRLFEITTALLWLFLAASLSYAGEAKKCIVREVLLSGTWEAADDAQAKSLTGSPCEKRLDFKKALLRDYENKGFLGVSVKDSLTLSGTLLLYLNPGSAWVWADAENLDSSGTRLDVFRRQTGIVSGNLVSPLDLERSDRKLSRIGYYQQMRPAQMFRDPNRNRIVPVYYMQAATASEAYALLTYSSETNTWEGNINVSLYNILGTARDLQLEGYTAENSRRLEGYYKEPWIFNSSWNVVVRGYFDEDSSARDAYGELGISRDLGFDFTVAAFLGIGEHRKTSTLEMTYTSLDRFILPRQGSKWVTTLTWNMDRPDSLDNYLKVAAKVIRYLPLRRNWITRFSGSAGGIFPTEASLDRFDYFALGGMDSFRGMDFRLMRSRAYGYSEFALLWQDGYDLSIEAFYQPGLYRAFSPDHGWKREQDYGIAFTQYRGNWSVNLYYALRNGESYLEGIIGFGLKTLF